MFFGKVGLQKEKCPECGGDVYCDPVEKDEEIISHKIICGKCGKEFKENEWPPPKKE